MRDSLREQGQWSFSTELRRIRFTNNTILLMTIELFALVVAIAVAIHVGHALGAW